MKPLAFKFSEAIDAYLIKDLDYIGWNKARVVFKEETPIKVNPSSDVAIVGSRLIQLTKRDYRVVC